MSSDNGADSRNRDRPLISIIVPVRNMERTISRTLESIASQTYPHVEVIVVDGQSRDRTVDRVMPFSDHLTEIVSEPDDGLYDAINKGLSRATGEIVGILNGDDYYCSERVLEWYAEKFRDNQVGMVFGDLEFFLPDSPYKTIRRYSSDSFRPDRLRYGWMPPHPATFIRRSVYEAIGNYRTDYEISADFEFLVRALVLNSVMYDRIDSVVVRMQYGGLSTSGVMATYTLNKEIIRACRENGLKTSWPVILMKFPAKLLEFAPAFSKDRDDASGNQAQLNNMAPPLP